MIQTAPTKASWLRAIGIGIALAAVVLELARTHLVRSSSRAKPGH